MFHHQPRPGSSAAPAEENPMRRVSAGLLMLGWAFAQPSPEGRDALQEAYRNWRQADPALEREATSAAATLGARADKVSSEGAKYFALRKAYLESLATDANPKTAAPHTGTIHARATEL